MAYEQVETKQDGQGNIIIDALKIEFWDGSVFFCRDKVGNTKERVRCIIDDRMVKFHNIEDDARRLEIEEETRTTLGGLYRVTKLRMQRDEYERIPKVG